jgi:hypothetical protein
MIGRFRQWLIDTYNGLYVIVLKPHMPSFATVAAVVLAVLFGIFWSYVVAPVTFYDAAPHHMSQANRDEWIKAVAGSYFAGLYDEEATRNLLGRVEDPAGNIQRLIPETSGAVQAALQETLQVAQGVSGVPAARPGNFISDVLSIVLALIIAAILALIISPVWRLLIKPNIFDNLYEALRPKTKEEIEEKKRQQADRLLIREKKEEEQRLRQESAAAAATNPYGAPIMQKLSIYTKGRAFDDSFAIEDANDMFLGECGATIAKTVGDSNELAAVEVWLFDKEDFVRTLNKLFVSEHAFNDPMLRGDLEGRVDNPGSDLVVARPGATIILETDAILLQIKVLDIKYGDNGILPPNSFFESLKLQFEAWQKSAAGVTAKSAAVATPAPVAAPQVVAPSTMFTPPPAQPAPPVTMPPSTPPPPPVNPPRRPPQDDDPFGGTGDFTPVG